MAQEEIKVGNSPVPVTVNVECRSVKVKQVSADYESPVQFYVTDITLPGRTIIVNAGGYYQFRTTTFYSINQQVGTVKVDKPSNTFYQFEIEVVEQVSGNSTSIQGVPVSSVTPLDSQVLTYVGADGQYEPKTPSGGGGVTFPVTKMLWVDNGRTDSYTPDGSLGKPFKTITGAVNQIITNGDNATFPYTVMINAGTYVETVDIGNALILDIAFVGVGNVFVQPASGDALHSLVNNNGLLIVNFNNIDFVGPVNFTDTTNPGNMLSSDSTWINTTFHDLTLKNVSGDIAMTECFFAGNIVYQNVNSGSMRDCNTAFAPGSLTMISDTGQPAPSSFFGSYLQSTSTVFGFGPVALNGPTAGGQIDVYIGTIVGSSGGAVTIQNGQLLRAFAGVTISSNITVNAGGEFRSLGATIRGTVANSGTYTQQGTSITAVVQAATYEVGSLPPGSNPRIVSGTGTPNSVVTGSPGDLYLNKSGGTSTTLYVKESGTSTNTGWDPMGGGGGLPAIPVTTMLYVDNRRADSYTADGSIGKPFKTIMAAVNQIITNNDNSASKPYGLFLATSVYVETVDLSNTALKCLVIMGNESTIGGQSLTDHAIKAVNNNNLTDLLICNCIILGGNSPGTQVIDFEVNAVAAPGLFNGALNTGSGCIFSLCQFASVGAAANGSIVIKNTQGTVVFESCYIGLLGDANNGLNFTNVQNVILRCGPGIAQGPVLNLVTDNTIAGYSNNSAASLRYINSQADIRVSGTGGTSTLTLQGVRQRYNVTLNAGSLLISQMTLITVAIVVNSGAEFDEYASAAHSSTLTVNAGGTYKQFGTLTAVALQLGTGTALGGKLTTGSGSPNGAVIGSPGDLFLNTAGGAATTLYVKESGAATNTGWVGK